MTSDYADAGRGPDRFPLREGDARVLFSSTPAFGHLLPMLRLARAARVGGAEVVVATARDLEEAVAPLTLTPAGPAFPDIAAEFYRRSGSPEVTDVDPGAFGELFGAVAST